MELNGEYIVYFKHPEVEKYHPSCEKLHKFIGKCVNFHQGSCVFENENKEMLIVAYRDIVQMRLKK